MVLREGILASVGAAASVRGEPETGKYWGVGVDAGTVAFCDHEAVAECMPEETEDAPWYEVVFDSERDDSWFALMDSPDHIRSGVANIVMPLAVRGREHCASAIRAGETASIRCSPPRTARATP